jgi:hypothetical protein
MIGLTVFGTNDFIVINPSIIAVVTRVSSENGDFTEVLLTIAGPQARGPVCYRVNESVEEVYDRIEKTADETNRKTVAKWAELMGQVHMEHHQ